MLGRGALLDSLHLPYVGMGPTGLAIFAQRALPHSVSAGDKDCLTRSLRSLELSRNFLFGSTALHANGTGPHKHRFDWDCSGWRQLCAALAHPSSRVRTRAAGCHAVPACWACVGWA